MFFLLILAIPLAGAMFAFAAGRFQIGALAVALAACAVEAGFIMLYAAPAKGVVWAGIGLTSNPLDQLLALAFTGAVVVSIIVSWQYGRASDFVSPALVTLSVALATLYVQSPYVVVFLLEAASFLVVFAALTGGSSHRAEALGPISAVLRYIILMTLASVVLTAGLVIGERFTAEPGFLALFRVAAAMLAVGFALRVGAAPFHLWLPSLARDTQLPVFILTVAVLTPAAVVFILPVMEYLPMFRPSDPTSAFPLLVVGAGIAGLGAVLTYAQSDLRRALAYVATTEVGFVLAGFAAFSTAGMVAGLFQTLNYIVFMALMAVCVASVHNVVGKTGYADLGGLFRSMPVTTAGFIVAALGIAGLPPFGGFAGRFLLYQSAVQVGAPLVIFLAIANFAGLAAYVRAINAAFFSGEGHESGLRDPLVSVGLIGVLVAVSLYLGLHPQPALDIIQSTLKELSIGAV